MVQNEQKGSVFCSSIDRQHKVRFFKLWQGGTGVNKKERQNLDLDGLIHDVQVFLELSFQENDASLRNWIRETINKLESRCWKEKQCDETNCPAYNNECGRCWLIAGTMCGGKSQGRFSEKYGFCTDCEVYRNVIGEDKVRRLKEMVIALIHSLRIKQKELADASAKVKILSGLLPICASCKKIKNEHGYWRQLESFIQENSEAGFTHSICPACIKKLYPEFADDINQSEKD